MIAPDRRVALGRLFRRSKLLGYVDEQMLSVYRERGVVVKDEALNPNKTADDRSIYQLVEPGWLVVNRMKAWQGSVGIADLRGIVSGHYICFAPTHNENHRYLHYLLRSPAFTSHFAAISRGVRPGQIEIDNDKLAATVLSLPPVGEQGQIADFLDDQVARIDSIIAARRSQLLLLDEAEASSAFDILSASEEHDRRATEIGWLPSVPRAWPTATVHAAYSVQLGKMLDESKFTGLHAIPYLRNTNVQWDLITTDDLKTMDIPPEERERFTVRGGDLLICEGGQPGRSAVWDGSIAVLGYQKALHRARPRNDSDVRWLQLVLRVAVHQNAFGVEFGQATIGHLTGEQLRALRLPMPAGEVQRSRASEFASIQRNLHSVAAQLQHSVIKLGELERSLVTAAVTGEFDVSSADGSQVPIQVYR